MKGSVIFFLSILLVFVSQTGCSQDFQPKEAEVIGGETESPDLSDEDLDPANYGVDHGVSLEGNSVEAFSDFEFMGTNVKYTPAMQGADKLLVLLHGAGGGSQNLENSPEYLQLIDAATGQGFFVVIPESTDRAERKWFSGSALVEENEDLKYISDIIEILLWNRMIQINSDYFALGHSNGGAFASVLAYSLDFNSVSINGASGIDLLLEDPSYRVPTIFAIGEEDLPERIENAENNFHTLKANGVSSEFYINYGVGHPFSSQHSPAILSFFMGLNQAPSAADFVYASKGPEEKDEIDGVTLDADGFTYVSGDLIGTVSFNGVERTSRGLRDIFIAKLDSEGNEIEFWQYGTEWDEVMYDITSDNNGGLIVNGTIGDGTSFPNGDTSYRTLTMKVDSQTGEVLWQKTFGSGGGNEVVADAEGMIYLTYMSAIGLDFEDGEGLQLAAGGNTASYIVKLNRRGDVLWYLQTTSDNRERVRAIDTGYNDTRVIVGFEFWNGIQIGNGKTYQLANSSRTSRGAYAILDAADGRVIHEQVIETEGIANVRGAGGFSDGLYVHGIFQGQMRLPGLSLESLGSTDSYLLRLDESGRVQWAKSLGSTEYEGGGEVAVNSIGDVFLTGSHAGESYSLLNSEGEIQNQIFGKTLFSQGFVVQLSSSGNLKWAESMNQKTGSSAGGVVEVTDTSLVVNVRQNGTIEALGKVYETFQPFGKDALVFKYSF